MTKEQLRASGEVLGTEIFELELPFGQDVTLVSDLHLDPRWPDKTAGFAALVARVPDGGRLIIPGDLFEFWVGRSQLRVDEWRAVPQILAGASARGVATWILHGNRDFQLDSAFARDAGVTIIAGGLHLRVSGRNGGRDLLILHGDELCTNDLAYQKSKRFLRGRLLRGLMHGLPYAWSRPLVDRGRKKSKQSVASRDEASLRVSRSALAQVARCYPRSDLLFGHVHQAASEELPPAADGPAHARGGLRYFVLPEFDVPDFGYATLRAGGAPRLVLAGADAPWPGPLTLGS